LILEERSVKRDIYGDRGTNERGVVETAVLAEAECREAHARLVLCRPTRRALLALGVHRFLARLAESKGGETVAVMVRGLV